MDNETYTVDSHGKITTPGRFEGEPLWVPHFNQVYLDDLHTTEDVGGGLIFEVQPQDEEMFPDLKGHTHVRLVCTDDGFVYGAKYVTKADLPAEFDESFDWEG